MLPHHRSKTFFKAPPSVRSMVAAFLEPVLIVLTYFAVNAWYGEPVLRSTWTLCLLAFTLTFPGRNRFMMHPVNAVVDIISAWVVLLAILWLFGYATNSLGYFEDRVILWWVVLTPLAQIAAVAAGRIFTKLAMRKPGAQRRAVIIGAGPLGEKVARSLGMVADHTVDVRGFFDDRHDARIGPDATLHWLGTLSDAAAYIEAHSVRDVYITIPLGGQPRIVQLLEELQGTTASLFFVPDVFGISVIQGRLRDVNGIPVVGILETPFTGTNGLVKRVTDIVLSVLILILISPILLMLAIGVKLSSPGPVLFRQRRNGLDGEEITVYKFRSMRTMDNGAVVKQATRGDPRITPFGAFIRRTSLDELPQFVNVLQGRMSIVGPRPHAVAHNAAYRKLIPAYMVRHKVKPGITGWAQVNGLRGETDTVEKMQARVEYDLEYLRNWSLALDLQIIARTVRLMVFDRHAY